MSVRWKLTIEYHGGAYVGWQLQENGTSIQGELETAIFKFCGETVRVTGAGRTDAGVHACGQVAHVDLAKETSSDVVRDALNAHLRPQPITVLKAEAVAPDFDARFQAKRRHYRYRILNRRAPPALAADLVWHIAKPLDANAMHAAAQALVGNHDFTSFRAVACQAKSPIKTIEALSVTRPDRYDDEIHLDAIAPSFLHHQIRNFAGTLKLVGEGNWSAEDVASALRAKDRAAGGPTAPAQGLYFMKVEY